MRMLFVLSLSFVLLGWGEGYADPVDASAWEQEVCLQKLPLFEERVETAILALSPWVEKLSNRAIASSSDAPLELHQLNDLALRDQEGWFHWAEVRLHEVQDDLDSLQSLSPHSASEKEFTFLANEIVSFHGYTQMGDVVKMIASLRTIQGHLPQLRQIACVKKIK